MPFRAHGVPYSAIEVHLAQADVRRSPSPFELDAETWEIARRAGDLFAHQTDEELTSRMLELLKRLASAGVIRQEAVDGAPAPFSPIFARLWSALRPMVERLYLAPTI